MAGSRKIKVTRLNLGTDAKVQSIVKNKPLDAAAAQKIDAYWRAANYLSVGQIYLYD